MAWNIIQFAFLLGVLVQTALAQVPPPANVTLQCHNIHNILRWNYDQLAPGLKFKVLVASESSGEPVELWMNSSTLHANLSSFSDPDDSYFVSVFAVMGDNVSAPSEGITYSYFQDAIVDQKCNVDFPEVNVTVLEDNIIHFRFMHPWLLYNPNPIPKKKKNHGLPLFEYRVQVINQSSKDPHRFSCDKKVCEEKTIPVDSNQDTYCVHVEGTVNKISVQSTQEYCSLSEKMPETTPVYVLIGVSVLILIIIIITVMVCFKKIRPPTSMKVPEMLKKFDGPNHEQLVPKVDEDETCVVHVEPASSTHLLTTSDVNDSTLVDAPSIESDNNLPNKAQPKDTNANDQAEAIQEDVEESGYKKGNDLDEDSSQNMDFSGDTGYEKRSTLE